MGKETTQLLNKIIYYLNILYLVIITIGTIVCFANWYIFLMLAAFSSAAPGSCEGIGMIVPTYFMLMPLVVLAVTAIAYYYFNQEKYLKSMGISLGLFVGLSMFVFILGQLSYEYYK